MAKSTLYNINASSPVQITREEYQNVGTATNQVGDVKRAFFDGTDFEIWDSAVGGTQLIEGTDYQLVDQDNFYSNNSDFGLSSQNIFTGYQILNPTYQTGSIYITYKILFSYVDADSINSIIADLTPAGVVSAYMGETVPTGWLFCDGAAVSRMTYSDLFSAIGEIYGNGDGSTTFNLPDLRGYFLRGQDDGAGNDPDAASRTDRGDSTTGDNVGTKQTDAFQGHWHNFQINTVVMTSGTDDTILDNSTGSGFTSNGVVKDAVTDGVNGTPRTSSETRAKNIYVKYIIRT